MIRPLFIGGATGTGKSGVALAIAEREGSEIVNADAFQLYRGLEIVSAAPTAEEQSRVPHHLYGRLELEERCNAARFAEIAGPVIEEVIARSCRPIVVGGSGLYLKALTHGLADLPPADPALRAELDALSLENLVAKLRELDTHAAEEVNLRNRRYVSRAVEICLLTGRPASEVKRGWRQEQPDFDGVILKRPRDQLYARIDARVPAMIADGMVEEIRSLPESISDTAVKAIGVREIRAHLAGQCSLEESVAAIQQASRRFAKRQLTWFRRETGYQSVCLAESESPESAAERILELFPPTTTDA